VERDLDSAPHGRAVDCGERDEGKVAESSEELVPRFAAEACTLGCDLSELVDVCADREDERLSRQEEPAPVARPQLTERVIE
jgi:hypothetical protein